MNITPELIRSFKPCYDPVTGLDADGDRENDGYLSEDYSATVVEFLNHPKIPITDKFWLVLREEIIPAKTLRLFAVRCAREAFELIDNPDPRSVEACDVAERFANGKASKEELESAMVAARDAAFESEWIEPALPKVALVATAVAMDSARLAALDANVYSARLAADSLTWYDGWKKQIQKLIELLE